jgi:hypothetical protein
MSSSTQVFAILVGSSASPVDLVIQLLETELTLS